MHAVTQQRILTRCFGNFFFYDLPWVHREVVRGPVVDRGPPIEDPCYTGTTTAEKGILVSVWPCLLLTVADYHGRLL